MNQTAVKAVTDICSVVIIGGKTRKTTGSKSVRAFDSGNHSKIDLGLFYLKFTVERKPIQRLKQNCYWKSPKSCLWPKLTRN